MTHPRDGELENLVRAACDRGDHRTAATALIESVGPKVLAFLLQRLRNVGDASEVFSMFCEDLWRGLPDFGWRCTARGWCFVLARNASERYRKGLHRRAHRNVPLSEAPLSQLAQSVREQTLPHLRTDMKNRMRERFEQLADDDRALLQLRLDQQLSWRDLAVVLEYAGENPAEAELKKSAEKLAQRFHRLKERLRQSPPGPEA